jgi:hypothetical protein
MTDPWRGIVERCFWFVKHKGKPLRVVPTGYLAWALANVKLSGGLRAAVRAELRRRPDCPRNLPPEPGPEDIRCHRCGAGNPKLSWHQLRDGRRTIRADCCRCNHHINFAPLTLANVAAADANMVAEGAR